MGMNYKKYKHAGTVELKNRSWPDKIIKKSPVWCSVDLRDGNQALPVPMSVEEKIRYFKMLLEVGFKEIEIGFPSASETEFNFLRKLIEDNLIPDDVTIQVLTQAREHLIEKTFEALDGCKNAILHLYNSTSVMQRKAVFQKEKSDIIDIALNGVRYVKELSKKYKNINVKLEYSPESFTQTEMDYALEICEAVIEEWDSFNDKIIINLPATVEVTTPNIYADQIEWFSKNLKKRKDVIISLHTHNDRGCSVAATELAIMAGADRVEGTLFGNGERTGNLDLVTLALNLFSQGVDPVLNLSNINHVKEIYELTTRLKVAPRHPYAGELVYTAFSGSHQDAIRKGLHYYHQNKLEHWDVPYLPIDPSDVGRQYEPIIRINSQSGKGGVAYIMENIFGYKMPKSMHPEFGMIVQKETDRVGKELKSDEIFDLFEKEYLSKTSPYNLIKYEISEQSDKESDEVSLSAVLSDGINEFSISGNGNGPIDAFFKGLKSISGLDKYIFISYDEHALTEGADSKAVCYIQLSNGENSFYGVGIAENITKASLKAILNAINRDIGTKKSE